MGFTALPFFQIRLWPILGELVFLGVALPRLLGLLRGTLTVSIAGIIQWRFARVVLDRHCFFITHHVILS